MNLKNLFILFLILIIPIVSASIQVNNSGIQENYALGDKASGWVNISLNNENLNSLVSSNYPGSLVLSEMLNNVDYDCSPIDCENSYSFNNAQNLKQASLTNGQNKLFALVFNGHINDIIDISFNITSNNAPSCSNPFKLDIFNDGIFDASVKKIGNDFSCLYGTGKGCFNSSSTIEVFIGRIPYCEKMYLIDSNKFRIGAWVRKDAGSTEPEDNLLASIWSLGGEELAYCRLPNPTLSGGEIYCNVSYDVSDKQEYYVCIGAENGDTTPYVIKKESPDISPCGFYAVPGDQTEYHDYYIFAVGAKFENIGQFKIDRTNYESLSGEIRGYLSSRYNDNCTQGCAVPINVSAYSNLELSLSNLRQIYSSGAGIISENKFYDAEMQQSRVSTGFFNLDIGLMNITLPNTAGNYTLIIYLNGGQIANKKISVGNIPSIKGVYPRVVPAGAITKITADIQTAGKNITKYNWNFGDSSSILTSSTNYAEHIYASIGTYELSLEIEDILGDKYSKVFSIDSVSPEAYINSTIRKYKQSITNLTQELLGLDSFTRNLIQNIINLSELSADLTELERDYYLAENESEYVIIMNALSMMDIPNKITISGTNLPWFVDIDSIDLEKLESLGAGSYEGEEEYKNAIVGWAEENFEMNIDFKFVYANFDNQQEELFAVFKVNINQIGDYDDEIYFVIDNPSVVFDGIDGVIESNYAGAEFESMPYSINFASYSIENIGSLNIYFSPKFSSLEINVPSGNCNYNNVCEKELGETKENCSQDCRPWNIAWVLWVGLGILAVIVYILLQWWYRVNYENYLFKNRNDIYNILNFISNAKSQGIRENTIASGLKNSGWNNEQVNYVFKKMKGKAIMPFSFFKMFRKRENRFR